MGKICKKCSKLKLLEEFHFHFNKHDTKIYSSCCTLCRRESARMWNKNNKGKHAEHQAKWRKSHPELDYQRSKDRYNRIEHKIKSRLRNRLRDAIKNNQKTGSAVKDLGCSIEEFKIYLESKFTEGMNWNNWSLYGWHLDHIKPLSLFNLTNIEELLKACHYTNLQPLWAKDNLTKGDKITL